MKGAMFRFGWTVPLLICLAGAVLWGQDVRAAQSSQQPRLAVETVQAEGGAQAQINIVLDRAPQGIKRYDLIVTVADPRVAIISQVTGVAISGFLFQVLEQTPNRTRFRALDLNEQVQAGAPATALAQVTLNALAPGRTEILLSVVSFIDDAENVVAPQVSNGMLIVGGAVEDQLP